MLLHFSLFFLSELPVYTSRLKLSASPSLPRAMSWASSMTDPPSQAILSDPSYHSKQRKDPFRGGDNAKYRI